MTAQPPERMIPLLPCRSIDDQLAFYEALGFSVTYRQKAPNVYAAVQRGGIELHFFVMKGYDPAGSYSTCYVLVTEIDALYAAFRAGLKRTLGRIPTRGIPRIGVLKDMSYGVRQFLMTDPGGNIIRIGQPIEAPAARTDGPATRLEKALAAAVLLADSKGDPETAGRVLDGALAVTADAPPATLVRARTLRADAAHAMGDDALAAALLDHVAHATLADDERAGLADELARANDLRRTLGERDG
jgi:catechol 2,3-dioxygenase-like lactoylglutathione lyase family enzyme